ncbi:Shk1 kinase-binding protein (Skb1), putative, partial [Ixodes scapularis]
MLQCFCFLFGRYKFIAVDISHPRYRQELLDPNPKSKPTPFARSDLVLPSQGRWRTLRPLLRGITVELGFHEKDVLKKSSAKVLERELCYAAHVGVPAIIINLKGPRCINMARLLHNYLLVSTSYQLMFHAWIALPMEWPGIQSARYRRRRRLFEMVGPCCRWNTFRSICGTDKRLGVALRLSADLPNEQRLRRWLGEPVRCLLVPTSLFMTNKKGYPVLPKPHQVVIMRFLKLECQVLVEGSCHHEHMKLYYQYIDHLYNTQPPDDPLAEFAKGFEDHLQTPLQPLMDNLESVTYEVFEKDPVKYTEYQGALKYFCRLSRLPANVGASRSTLMVVGAGRGPLVRAALSAAELAHQKVKVYAIEKNPNAVLTLLSQKEEVWQDRVTVVSCDMREFEAPEKADILVSELLGSFGDNELSPECLDGAQRFLKEDGISIPCSYQSYLGPVQSHKLYSEVTVLREKDKHPLTSFETPHIVRLHNVAMPASPQPLFSFVHPNRGLTL